MTKEKEAQDFFCFFVMPAQAGIHVLLFYGAQRNTGIPGFAGHDEEKKKVSVVFVIPAPPAERPAFVFERAALRRPREFRSLLSLR